MRPDSSAKSAARRGGLVRRLYRVRPWAFSALLLGAMALAACGGGDDGPTRLRNDSFSVGPSPTLEVDVENGRIVVRAEEGTTIHVQATVKNAPRVEYTAVQSGNTVTVVAHSKNTISGPGGEADLTITVPPNTSVDLKTVNGNVELWHTEGTGTLKSTNGDIVLVGVKGEFGASTTAGDIVFDGELVPDSDNKLTTVNGDASIGLSGKLNVSIDATTTNGSVDVRWPDLEATVDSKRHVTGTIGDGEAGLLVSTVSGNVTVL